MESRMGKRLRRLGKRIMDLREPISDGFWLWLSTEGGKTVSKKGANKFFLCCIIDYQQKAERAWRAGRAFCEDFLGVPDDLWGAVVKYDDAEWDSIKSEAGLHYLMAGHRRVLRIGRMIHANYGGDVRNIWAGQKPCKVYDNLMKMRMGPQLSRMVIGALLDTGAIDGTGDIKADTHLMQVLGRVADGKKVSPDRAITLARKMNPENPWLLDRPCYLLGLSTCFAEGPICEDCPLEDICKYAQSD